MLKLENISQSFDGVSILENIDFELGQGESVAVVGPSGSGKTTLLNIASLLSCATSGKISYFNDEIPFSKNKFLELRKKYFSFVYQQHNLMQEFSILENIEIIAKIKNVFEKDLAISLLENVGLKDHIHKKPSQLSGGQKQRASIVRAICAKPKILFADEPTGNLDLESSNICADLLINLAKNHNVALFLITHNLEIAKKCDKIFQIENRKLVLRY